MVTERLLERVSPRMAWAVATDGQVVQTNAVVRELDPADERTLVDLVLVR